MGRANTTTSKTELRLSKSLSYAPLAQSVEHAAVNRSVVGSSPTRGAKGASPPFKVKTANMDFGVQLPLALNLGVFKICGSVICGLVESGI